MTFTQNRCPRPDSNRHDLSATGAHARRVSQFSPPGLVISSKSERAQALTPTPASLREMEPVQSAPIVVAAASSFAPPFSRPWESWGPGDRSVRAFPVPLVLCILDRIAQVHHDFERCHHELGERMCVDCRKAPAASLDVTLCAECSKHAEG